MTGHSCQKPNNVSAMSHYKEKMSGASHILHLFPQIWLFRILQWLPIAQNKNPKSWIYTKGPVRPFVSLRPRLYLVLFFSLVSSFSYHGQICSSWNAPVSTSGSSHTGHRYPFLYHSHPPPHCSLHRPPFYLLLMQPSISVKDDGFGKSLCEFHPKFKFDLPRNILLAFCHFIR